MKLFKRLTIEIISNCNRDCQFCPRQTEFAYPYRKDKDGKHIVEFLSTNVVEKILKEMAGLKFFGPIVWNYFSEATLDTRLSYFLELAKKEGFINWLFTNGDILQKDTLLQQNFRKYLDCITVGIYDVENLRDIELKKKYWLEKLDGVKNIGFSSRKECELYKKSMPAFNGVLCENDICVDPRDYFKINYNGRISICCYDIRNEFIDDNIYEKSVADIYYSKGYQKIISDLSLGLRSNYRLCSTCRVIRNNGHRIFK